MSKLKPQHQLFAEAIAKGMSGEDAMKHAGYKSRGASARTAASRLRKLPAVSQHLEYLMSKAHDDHVDNLMEMVAELIASAKSSSDRDRVIKRLSKITGVSRKNNE